MIGSLHKFVGFTRPSHHSCFPILVSPTPNQSLHSIYMYRIVVVVVAVEMWITGGESYI